MIENNFSNSECAKAVRFSGGQFEFIVEPLHCATGNDLFCTKPIEQKLSVRTKHSGNFLHRFYSGSHSPLAPAFHKLSCPKRRDVVPKELKVFLEQVTTHSLEVVPQQIGKPDLLACGEVFRSFQQAPSGMSENGSHPLGPQIASFLCADFVDRFVHMHRNMEAVQHMDGLAGFLGNHSQVRFPHVTADKMQLGRAFLAKVPKESQQSPDRPVPSHPQQPLALAVDLINNRQVLVSSLPQYFIDSNRTDIRQIAVGEAPLHGPLHGVEDFAPGRLKDSGHFLPREPFRPRSQKLHVGVRQRMFSLGPRHGFHFHPAPLAVDTAQSINEKHRNAPEWNELELSRFQGVIPRPPAAAARADRAAMSPGDYLDQKCETASRFRPFHVSVNKGLELLHPIQNSFQLHPDLLSRNWNVACQSYPIQDRRQDALYQSPQISSGVADRSSRCQSFLFFNFEKEKNPRACGNVGKSRRFLAGLFHISIGHYFRVDLYPQI